MPQLAGLSRLPCASTTACCLILPPLRAAPAVIFTEVIKLLICLVMQFKAIAGEVAGGTAGKPSPPPGSSSSLGAMHSSSSSAASLFGGAGQPGSQGALVREVRRQARDIAAKSLPMLLPAGMFVMQQVRRERRALCRILALLQFRIIHLYPGSCCPALDP